MNPYGDQPSADELLAALLSEPEMIAVLRYSQDKGLDSDDVVFFLVAMLKVFALVYDRMVATVTKTEEGRENIERAVAEAVHRIDSILTDRATVIREVMKDACDKLAYRTSELHAANGAMQVLREQLDVTVRDATEAFKAYQHLRGTPETPTLVRLFHDRLCAALDNRVPAYDQVFRSQMLDTILLGMGRYFVMVQIELAAICGGFGLLWYFGS